MSTEEKKVKAQDPVLIEYTDKARFHKAGQLEKVHSLQAEKLIAKGVAKYPKK